MVTDGDDHAERTGCSRFPMGLGELVSGLDIMDARGIDGDLELDV